MITKAHRATDVTGLAIALQWSMMILCINNFCAKWNYTLGKNVRLVRGLGDQSEDADGSSKKQYLRVCENGV